MTTQTAIEGFNRQISIALDAAKDSFERGDLLDVQNQCTDIICNVQQLHVLTNQASSERTTGKATL